MQEFLTAFLISLSPCGAFEQPIMQASAHHSVPPRLLADLLWLESHCNPKAVSHKGAQGIAQFMPKTAQELSIDPFDPIQAIWEATRHLHRLRNRLGSWCWAVAAYNAGSNRIRRALHPNNWPRETRAYVFSLGFSLRTCQPHGENR